MKSRRELDLELVGIALDFARRLKHPKQYSPKDIEDKLQEFDRWVVRSDAWYMARQRRWERARKRKEQHNYLNR